MRIQALSVVAPWGMRIAEGKKTREIRSWRPDSLPIPHLLIVENDRRLKEGDSDPDGRAVAVVRISEIHDWTPEEAEAACSTWEPGWLSWVIEDVRPIAEPFQVLAARRLYEVEVPDNLLL